MKRLIGVLAVAAGLMVPILLIPSGAGAAPPNGGGYCGASATGCAAAPEAQCGSNAGSGAYGAFGNYGDVTHDFGVNNPGSNGKPGADGHQTGLNNSAVCGNRQGNLP